MLTATLPGYRTMNPCPVYERNSGTVFLFFICVQTHITESHQIATGRNAARLCFVTSQDGGRTWKQTTDVTAQVIGEDLKNWATFGVGPGHGEQLSSGRLVIPSYAYYIHKRFFHHSLPCFTKAHCLTFYSDDHGQSWARGQLLMHLKTNECQVAELSSQHASPVLYCSARSPDRQRAEAFSTDGGEQFGESYLSRELSEPGHGCQGSVVSFIPVPGSSEVGQKEDAGELARLLGIHPSRPCLIFSHPTHRHKRVNLGIYLNTSPLEKGSWKAPWVLYEGPSGYSDLAVCDEGKSLLFACLFECGESSSVEEIAFQVFTYDELLRNVRDN